MDSTSPPPVTPPDPQPDAATPPERVGRTRERYRRLEFWLFRRRRNQGSVAIALLMVVVSIATGPVTYLATSHEANASEIDDSRLHNAVEAGYLERVIQAMLEHEQRTLLTFARHDAEYRAHVEASAAAGADVGHELGLQSEHDQLLALRGQFLWAQPTFPDGLAPAYPVEDARARLEDSLETGRLKEIVGSADSAIERAETERQTSLRLVGLILALVAALLLFTAAQVTPTRSRRVFAIVASGVALATVAALVPIDGSVLAWSIAIVTWLAFALIAGGVLASESIAGFLQGNVKDEQNAELIASDTGARGQGQMPIPDPGELGSIFSRAVVLTIAAATVCGAWIGYLQADAFGRSDAHAVAAQGYSVDALLAGEQAISSVLAQLEVSNAATESAVAMWGANQAMRFQGSERGTTQGHHEAEIALGHARLTAETMDALALSGSDEPGATTESDNPFLRLADASREPDRLTALQFLADGDARDWEGRGNFYVRWLVVLAVAVYLLGLAVVIPGFGVKVLFLAAGGAGVVLATGVTMWTIANHPRSATTGAPERSEAAAAGYADGRLLLANGDYVAAIRSLTAAIDQRPDFSRGHSALATAWILSGSPQVEGYVSVTTTDATRHALAEFRAASETGGDTYGVQASLGYHQFVLALQLGTNTEQQGLLQASVEASRRAAALIPGHPLPHFNIAVAEVARGDVAAATAAYEEAIRLSRGDPERPGYVYRDELLAGALTDLEVLRAGRGDLADDVDRWQEMLVRQLSGPKPLSGAGIDRTMVSISLLPTTFSWSASLDGLDPERDTVTQVWFRRTDSGEAWAVDGYADELHADAARESGDSIIFLTPDQENVAFRGESDVAARTGSCLRDGQYRVDLYVNGSLAARSEPTTRVDSDSPEDGATAWWPRDIGLLACVLPSWERVDQSQREPGRVDAVTSPDGSSGLVFARVHFGGAEALDRPSAVLEWIRKDGISVVPRDLILDPEGDLDAFFLGRSSDRTEIWRSTDQEYRAQAGVTLEGTVLIAILFGPTGFLETDGQRPGPIGLSYVQMDAWQGLYRPEP